MINMDSKRNDEFSSRTMLNILQHGASLCTGNKHELNIMSTKGAHAPLSSKREFIAYISSRYNREKLLLLGDGVKKMLHEPTVALLVHRSSPKSLLERWQRLERYIHSSHTINVNWLGDKKLSLEHVSYPDMESPSIEEDFVVLGVLISLLSVVGAKGITLHADNNQSLVFDYDNREQKISLPITRPDTWTIEWSSTGDVMVLCESIDQKLITNGFSDWPQFALETANAIVNTSVLTPRVDDVACYMNYSRRTLQRRLRDINLSFSKIVMETRVRIAASWLMNSELTMAEVGFISGFSDQPHFNRTFKSLIGMSPKHYHKFIS